MTKGLGELKDRRKFIRVSIYAITRYFCLLRGREVEVQTRISDISEGGAQIVNFMEGIPTGTPVKMSFVTPGDQGLLVSVEGIARHTGALDQDLFRTGIEFRNIKEKDLLTIRRYIASCPKK